MRILFKAEMSVEAGNEAHKTGKLSETIQAILEEQKPEAAYFYPSNGKRTALLILNLKDASQIPGLAEPWFLAFNAAVEIIPVMTPEDLAKAGPSIEKAVKKYARQDHDHCCE